MLLAQVYATIWSLFCLVDVRAKIASGLTCPLVFMLYVTILIIRYRRSLSYDYDDGTLSEDDMLKKTRVSTPTYETLLISYLATSKILTKTHHKSL